MEPRLSGVSIRETDSFEALLDEIQLQAGRNDDQRSMPRTPPEETGSDVFLNVYDMVGACIDIKTREIDVLW